MAAKAIIALLVALLICCNAPLSGNGTGTDIGEARISGAVKLPGALAAENVTITIRKQDYIPFSIASQNQRRTVSGRDGAFSLTVIRGGYYLAELFLRDSLCATKRFSVADFDSAVNLGDLMLDTLTTCAGKVFLSGEPATGANLLVMGMDRKISTTGDGSFSLRLPRGEHLFRIITGTGENSGEVVFSDRNSGDTIHVNTAPVTMFDDFENRDGCNALAPILGNGSWFAYTDKEGGGSSRILPTEDPGLVAAIDSTSGAYRGGSLHCVFQIDSMFQAPYALIGADISGSKIVTSGKSWFDFTRMTALTFMAKGTGIVYVQFTCRLLDSPTGYAVYEIPIALSPAWNTYTVSATEIPNAIGTAQSWTSGNKAVSNINFLAKRNADLWIDDIEIKGMNLTDFVK